MSSHFFGHQKHRSNNKGYFLTHDYHLLFLEIRNGLQNFTAELRHVTFEEPVLEWDNGKKSETETFQYASKNRHFEKATFETQKLNGQHSFQN